MESYPSLESVIQFFTDNGSTEDAARKYYNYYTLHDWKTAKGEPITNVKESVKRWIARDARFWSRKTGRSHGNFRNSTKQHTPVPDSDQAGSSHIPAASATPYWDGTCVSPSNIKPGSFRDFEQRNYDFDALQRMLTECAI